MPRCSSMEDCPHAPVFPVYDQESWSHVSNPASPGLGMVWKIHLRLPVRTSYPRTYPLTLVLLVGTPPGLCAAPTTMVFLPMMGVAWMPISLLSGSIS